MTQLIEAAGADRVITCDLNNPAIQAYFSINCDRLSAQNLLQSYFKGKNLEDMVIVATDAGSSEKAYKYSEYFGCPTAIIDKIRTGSDDKAIATTVIGEVKNKNAIIFDDEVDTAGSMIETAKILEKFQAKNIYAGCMHGILSEPEIEKIKIKQLKNWLLRILYQYLKKMEKITILSIAPLFAGAIKRFMKIIH